MSEITIYHNPACSTSRGVLEIICAAGYEPVVIEYLKNPPDRETLTALIQGMGRSVREVMRTNVEPYEKLGLSDLKWTDDQLIDFMVEYPILINRPIVVTERGAALCRPKESVSELLP